MDCIFCKIANKEIPSEVVYEDNDFLAFLDINPRGPGHTLVIPKKHYKWVWDVPGIGKYFEVVQKIALAQQKAFGQELIRSQVFGDEIAHAHVWVWPASAKASAGKPNHDAYDFKTNAKKLKNEINQAA